MILNSPGLNKVLDTLDEKTIEKFKPGGYYNLSDFIDVSYHLSTNTDQKQKLKLTGTNCAKDTGIDLVSVTDDLEDQARYKCFAFEDSYNFLNITRNETLMKKAKGTYSIFQKSSLTQIVFRFEMKELLVKLLKIAEDKEPEINLNIIFWNYKLTQYYEIEQFYFSFHYKFDLNNKAELDLDFKKLSISKKFKLDFYDIVYYNKENYMILGDSFQSFSSPRNKLNTDVIDYTDSLSLNLIIFEENNEVIFLTLDDIMAVLGGFYQIFMAAAEFVVGFYNTENAKRYISNHIMSKYDGYEKIIDNVRSSINMQKYFYNNKMHSSIQSERDVDVNMNNKKCSSDINICNLNRLRKNKNDDGIDDRKPHEQNSMRASFESNHDYFNKVCIQDNFDNENGNIYNNRKSEENKQTNLGGNTQNKKDCLQNCSSIYDKVRFKSPCKTFTDCNDIIDDLNIHEKIREDSDRLTSRKKSSSSPNNFLEEKIGEEYIFNERKISDKLTGTNFHNKSQEENENEKNKEQGIKDFSNQLIELNNKNNKNLRIENESFSSQKAIEENNNNDINNLFRSDEKDLKNHSHYLNKTDDLIHNDKRFSMSKNFEVSKTPLGIRYANHIILI